MTKKTTTQEYSAQHTCVKTCATNGHGKKSAFWKLSTSKKEENQQKLRASLRRKNERDLIVKFLLTDDYGTRYPIYRIINVKRAGRRRKHKQRKTNHQRPPVTASPTSTESPTSPPPSPPIANSPTATETATRATADDIIKQEDEDFRKHTAFYNSRLALMQVSPKQETENLDPESICTQTENVTNETKQNGSQSPIPMEIKHETFTPPMVRSDISYSKRIDEALYAMEDKFYESEVTSDRGYESTSPGKVKIEHEEIDKTETYSQVTTANIEHSPQVAETQQSDNSDPMESEKEIKVTIDPEKIKKRQMTTRYLIKERSVVLWELCSRMDDEYSKQSNDADGRRAAMRYIEGEIRTMEDDLKRHDTYCPVLTHYLGDLREAQALLANFDLQTTIETLRI